MEALIANLIGWVGTSDAVINILTGMRIADTTAEETEDADESTAENSAALKATITYPNGDEEDFEGPDAELILDRAEALAEASGVFLQQLQTLVEQVKGKKA